MCQCNTGNKKTGKANDLKQLQTADTVYSSCDLQTAVFLSKIFLIRNLSELPITTTSEKAIEKELMTGLRKPAAAMGMATTLYISAQNRFCLMVVRAAPDKTNAFTTGL